MRRPCEREAYQWFLAPLTICRLPHMHRTGREGLRTCKSTCRRQPSHCLQAEPIKVPPDRRPRSKSMIRESQWSKANFLHPVCTSGRSNLAARTAQSPRINAYVRVKLNARQVLGHRQYQPFNPEEAPPHFLDAVRRALAACVAHQDMNTSGRRLTWNGRMPKPDQMSPSAKSRP